jgi:Xaa-Pro aminopeptidase
MPAAATMPRSPYATRLARLKKALAAPGADSFLVTNPTDVAYLTGFLGGDSYLLLGPGRARPIVISDFRYQEELQEVKPLADLHIRRKGLLEATADILSIRGVEACAIQAECMTVGEFEALQRSVGKGRLLRTTGLVAALRERKDPAEVALIRKAIRIQEQALLAILATIRPGQSEMAIAAALEAEMKSRGSTEPGFTTIVASGSNGSLPHYRAGPARVARNKPLLIDWGAVYRGYHGDMTRVFCLGKWPARIAEIYRIVLEAQQMAAAALAPGRSTREIDAIARDHISRAGYGEHFGHGLGHGMGLKGHEDPRLSHLTPNLTLQPGNVVTVEPGIYLPGLGGVRIEDDYLITDTGSKNLCTLPKDIEWATL